MDRQHRQSGAGVAWALVCALAAVSPGALHAENSAPQRLPRDVVILVDVSSSMDDIFPTVQASLQEFIGTTRRGDFIALARFSDEVTVVAQREIRSADDRTRLQAQVAALTPSGRFTNITVSLYRATRILRDAARRAGGEERVGSILLITDGRHNPPAGGHAPSFDDILNRYGDFRAGQHWFIHYIAVGDVLDDATERFLQAAHGQVSRLEKDQVGGLGALLDQLEIPCPIGMRDVAGDVWITSGDGPQRQAAVGSTVLTGDRVTTGRTGRAVITFGDFGVVGVDPNTSVEIRRSSHNPGMRSFTVNLWLTDGRVWSLVERTGFIAFQVRSPQLVSRVTGTFFMQEVAVADGGATVAVTEGMVHVTDGAGVRAVEVRAGLRVGLDDAGTPGAPQPWRGGTSLAQQVWRDVLEGTRPLAGVTKQFAGVSWQQLAAEFGPVDAGETYRTTLEVDLGPLTGPALVAEVEGGLPPAMHVAGLVRSPVEGAGGTSTVVLRMEVAADWVVQPDMVYLGAVRLRGPDVPPELGLTFPLRVFTAPAFAPTVVTTAKTPVFWWLVGASIALPLLGGVYVAWRSQQGLVVPLGRLLLRKNPAPADWTSTSLDLEKLCTRRNAGECTIGSDLDNLIALPDPLVQPHHCVLRVRGRRRANRKLFLHLMPNATIRINEQTLRRGSVELMDGMLVRFGNFVFEYEDSRNKEQVEIALRDKEIVHGVLRTWDLDAAVFSVSEEDRNLDSTESIERMIPFDTVEDITILTSTRRTRQQERARMSGRGPRMTLTMQSGRHHTGWARRDYDGKKLRFYFFPDGRPDADYMIIERSAIDTLKLEER